MPVTTFVPLQRETEDGAVIWWNPTSSSTRFCRPVPLQLTNETQAVSQEELQRVRCRGLRTPATQHADGGRSLLAVDDRV